MPVCPSFGSADREDHRETQSNGEVEIELSAEVVVAVARAVLCLRFHGSGKHRGPDVAEIERWRSDLGEAHRREIHLARQLCELPRSDLVDVEPRKAFELAVSFFGTVIDVIVAERAE